MAWEEPTWNQIGMTDKEFDSHFIFDSEREAREALALIATEAGMENMGLNMYGLLSGGILLEARPAGDGYRLIITLQRWAVMSHVAQLESALEDVRLASEAFIAGSLNPGTPLPCPWCGYDTPSVHDTSVDCTGCDARGGGEADTPREAVENWNAVVSQVAAYQSAEDE